jgi:hypothetical protein
MNARRLLHWGDIEDARRRRARRGLGALSPWLYSVAAGVALAGFLARAMGVFGETMAGGATPAGASDAWLAVVAASHVVVLLGAPFRMYWRRDSAMIGRSAIPGDAIFTVALVRSVRAAARVALPCAMAAVVFGLGPHGSWEIALRHLTLVGIAFLWAGLLGPCVALAAGAIVASGTAQAALKSLSAEFEAPRTSWLGILPGLAGAGFALILIAAAAWSRGASSTPVGEPVYLLAASAMAPVVLVLWARARAASVMLSALREVAALDQERLAHVDLTTPSPLERLAGRVAASLRGDRARLVLEKDASLSRRRYPIPFFLGLVGLAALWVLAAVAPDDLLVWAGVISAGLGAYGVIMARRSMVSPIEYLAYLRTLPVPAAAVSAAKRGRLVLWIVVYMGLGAAAVIARAPQPGMAALLLCAIAAASLIAGAAVTRVDSA